MATVKLDPAKGVQIPNLTTTERNAISSPETGALIWNTTTSAINQYNGSAWEATDTNTQADITGKLNLSGGTMTGTIAGFTSTGIDDNATSTAVTLDSSGNVGIGTSSPSQKLHVAGNMYTTGYLNTAGSGTAGGVQFADGNLYMYRDTNDLAIKLQGAEKVRIQSGGGISFNGDTAAANALDDYEEGTWTATYGGSTSTGEYTKVGRTVTVRITLNNTASNFNTITGFPFAASGQNPLAAGRGNGSSPSIHTLGFCVVGTGITVTNDAGGATTVSTSGTVRMDLNGTYQTA